jgi:two-component system response regulator AtoC
MEIGRIILIVDDEASMRRNIFDLLSPKGYQLIEAGSGEEAKEILKSTIPDIVILDINLPGISGLEVLTYIKSNFPDIPCLMLTAYGTSEKAIEAMKSGAFDYLEKPFELDEFLIDIDRALEYNTLIDELKDLRKKVGEPDIEQPRKIVSKNARMQEIFKTIGRISTTDASVLIQGESGTGKELIADAIQRHSHLKDNEYVKINCGALSESLLESEIFGHEKGSFTGAVSQRKGLFEIADGGTIFLDEVNSMPPSLQVKLLRIIQGESFFRVGGNKSIKSKVRIIAATNKDIEKEVNDGRFREDLYYRLNVVRINVPPLRERPDDIDVLIDYFLKKYCPERKFRLQEESLRYIHNYNWPGNVRELENTIHRALIMTSDNIIRIGKLPIETRSIKDCDSLIESCLKESHSYKNIVADFEKKVLEEALKINHFNQTKTAEFLKMNRRLLYTKIKEYGLQSKKYS